MGLHILSTKVPIDAHINMKSIQSFFWKTKQKILSTQQHDNLEVQVIQPQAQTNNAQLEIMHMTPYHLCMQE
jgi:hypothetical protein